MLSDACSDFACSENHDVKHFLEMVEWYGKPDYPIDYPPVLIEALKKACLAALANPEDKKLSERLVTLADAVREHYDSGGKVPLPGEIASAVAKSEQQPQEDLKCL